MTIRQNKCRDTILFIKKSVKFSSLFVTKKCIFAKILITIIAKHEKETYTSSS